MEPLPHSLLNPDQAVPAPAKVIRFCSGCGAAWQAEWDSCPTCTQRVDRAREQADQAYTLQRTSLRSALLLYFVMLAVCLVLLIIGLLSKEEIPLALELTFDVLFAGVVIAWMFPWFKRLRDSLLTINGMKWWLLGIPLGVATYTLAHFAVWAISLVFDVPMIGYLDTYDQTGYGLPLAVASICFMPAVFEEIAFRGVILSALGDLLSPWEAVLVSATMFAILHLSVPSVPHLFVMGAVAAWMRHRSGTLLPGMILHFTHNLMVLLSERSGSWLPW